MATMTNRILTLFFLTLLLAGCDETTGPADSSGGFVNASVDGAPYRSTIANATLARGVLGITSESAAGYNRELYRIDLNLNNVAATGTYELGALSGSTGHYYDGTSALNYQSSILPVQTAGSVAIKYLDRDSVAGTFTFTAYLNAGGAGDKSVRVDGGAFGVRITR